MTAPHRRLHRAKAIVCLTLIVSLALASAPEALAHPMGNFSISHYTRLTAERDRLLIRYLLDFAEIPALTELSALDPNGDREVGRAEKEAYLAVRVPRLVAGLSLKLDGRLVPLKTLSADVAPAAGAGGLQTLKVRIDLTASIPSSSQGRVAYSDGNFVERTGWREIVAAAGPGAILSKSSVSAVDRSRELSAYPAGVTPPQDRTAHFAVEPGTATPTAIDTSRVSVKPDAIAGTPRDAFTQAIAGKELTPAIFISGLLIAFVFGAFHALSPGHGKAMVAAYLVGSRGTARHAVLLGIIVTITHTLGVFALGFVALFLSQYIVPEMLYPVLGTVSGLAVLGVGLSLLSRNSRGLPDHTHHHHSHDNENAHEHAHEHSHDHPHDHSDDHHSHTHHSHAHHSHAHHHHMPQGPITLRALLALGVSGGIVPCPSALVVLLSAVALHRIAYGIALITSFSLGLAGVLVALGLMVVWAREWMDKLPTASAMMRRLPVASAAAITLIGALLLVRAWS